MERKLLNRIRGVLDEKDMTNKQLAELVGKDPAVVSNGLQILCNPMWKHSFKLSMCWK